MQAVSEASPSLRADRPPTNPLASAIRLAAALEAVGFAGWDPYDALTSPLLRPLARTRLVRGVFIQGFRRCPVNLRPLVGIRPRRHVKALALLTSAYVRLAQVTSNVHYRDLALRFGDELVQRRTETDRGSGWGYDFDVQTRWSYYRAGQPNAIATAFASHALIDLAELGARHDSVLEEVKTFARSLLVHKSDGDFFSYFAGSRVPIHNANMLVASLLARVEQKVEADVRRAVTFTLAKQRGDGSWPYGEGPRLDWVDGFHTAYVIDALITCQQIDAQQDVATGLARGARFYLDRLIDLDGAPRATVTSRYPIDSHAAASAMSVCVRLAPIFPEALNVARDVLRWTLAHLARGDGRFAFQLHRRYRNSIPYIRWSDGHMLLALARLAAVKGGRHG